MILCFAVGTHEQKGNMQEITYAQTLCYYTCENGYVTTEIHLTLVCTVISSLVKLMELLRKLASALTSAKI